MGRSIVVAFLVTVGSEFGGDMAKTRDLDKRDQARAAVTARLYADGWTQKEISELLKVSQTAISRTYIEYAIEHAWLQDTLTFFEKEVPEDILAWAFNEWLAFPELENKVHALGPKGITCNVRVVQGKGDAFFRGAGLHIADLLKPSMLAGLLWGRTLWNCVNTQRQLLSPTHKPNAFSVIPLCGDPHYLAQQEMVTFSSSNLARMLEKTLTGTLRKDAPNLVGLPAYVPRKPEKAERHEVLKYLHHTRGYARIFHGNKKNPALINNVDTILTGLGVVGNGDGSFTGTFLRERCIQEGISLEQIAKLVYGDLGGVLIARPGLTRKENQIVEDMQTGWIGVTRKHFEACAKRVANKHYPGVIVVAYSTNRVELICEVVRLGLVNELIIDHPLACALDEFLPKNDSSERISVSKRGDRSSKKGTANKRTTKRKRRAQ